MTTTTTTTVCAFCRSRGLTYVDHSVGMCSVLAKHQCSYCKKRGHTYARCPMKAAAVEPRPISNGWASMVAKNIPPKVAAKIAEEDRIAKEKGAKKREEMRRIETAARSARQLEAKARWERWYVRQMKTKYGLPEDFVVLSGYPDSTVFEKGEFWYFHTENTPDDHQIAQTLRQQNTEKFHAYLKGKYWRWLYDSQNPFGNDGGYCDDCFHLEQLRRKEAEAELEAEYADYERYREWDRKWEEEYLAKKEEELDMEEKRIKGEITEDAFQEWRTQKMEDQMDDYDDYAMEGIREYRANRKS